MTRSVFLLFLALSLGVSGCVAPADTTEEMPPNPIVQMDSDPEEIDGPVYPTRLDLECPSAWFIDWQWLSQHDQFRDRAGAIVTSAGVVGWSRAISSPFDWQKGSFCLEYVAWDSSRLEVVRQDFRERTNTFPAQIGKVNTQDVIVEWVAGSPASPWIHVVGRVIPEGYLLPKRGQQWSSQATHLLHNVETGEWLESSLAPSADRSETVYHPLVALTEDGSGGVLVEISQLNERGPGFDPADNHLIRFEKTGVEASEIDRLEIPLSPWDSFELQIAESGSSAVILIHPKDTDKRDPLRYILVDFDAGEVTEGTFDILGYVPQQVTFSPGLDVAYVTAVTTTPASAVLLAYDLTDGALWEKETGRAFPWWFPSTLPGTIRDPSGQGVFAVTSVGSVDESTWAEDIERAKIGEDVPFREQISFIGAEGQGQQSYPGCDLFWGGKDTLVIAPWLTRDDAFFRHNLVGALATSSSEQFYSVCAVSAHTFDGSPPRVAAYYMVAWTR